MFGDKIYACEDTLGITSCFICVGKDNCQNYRIGSLESDKMFLEALEEIKKTE